MRRGLVRVVMGDMSEEGVERAGVERERRSGASSVALEFKTPREPLTTFEMTAPSRFNPGLRICVSGLQRTGIIDEKHHLRSW